MKKALKQLASILAYGITDLEKVVYWHTGKILPMLKLRFECERRTIQAKLDSIHNLDFAI